MAVDKNHKEVLDIFADMPSSVEKTPHYSSGSLNRERKSEEEEGLEHETPEPEKSQEKERKPLSNASIWKRVMRGDLLSSKMIRSQLKLCGLIIIGLIIIVSMRYKVESLQKEKIATEERIGFLREHKIQMQKKYQESVKISRIAEELDTIGVGLISGPPYAI